MKNFLSVVFFASCLLLTALAISAWTADYQVVQRGDRWIISSADGETYVTAKKYVDGLIACDWPSGEAVVSRVARASASISIITAVVVYNRTTGDAL